MKKKTKTAQLEDKVRNIAQSKKTLVEKYNAYLQLKDSQTLLKRPPKDFKRGKWLFRALCENVVDRYLAASADAKPKFQGEYIRQLDRELQLFRERYNTVFDTHIYEYEVYEFTSNYRRARIIKRYNELHPDLAEADALLRSLTILRKTGIRNDALEKRFDEVTNGGDAMIIANLPFMEEIYERFYGGG